MWAPQKRYASEITVASTNGPGASLSPRNSDQSIVAR